MTVRALVRLVLDHGGPLGVLILHCAQEATGKPCPVCARLTLT